MYIHHAKNFKPVGLPHTKMHILDMMTAMHMYTRTGHRARDRVASVHVAHTSVETMAKAVIPEG